MTNENLSEKRPVTLEDLADLIQGLERRLEKSHKKWKHEFKKWKREFKETRAELAANRIKIFQLGGGFTPVAIQRSRRPHSHSPHRAPPMPSSNSAAARGSGGYALHR